MVQEAVSIVSITDKAAEKARALLKDRGVEDASLRVFVVGGGCSGYQYGMSFAENQQPGDWVGEFGGVKVFVDPQSAPVLEGVEVDWIETLQTTGFAIRNPNAARSCGCGKSFETH